jgi:general stress protein YciG
MAVAQRFGTLPRKQSLEPRCNERTGGQEGTVAIADRGFASMDRQKQREIASKGGRVAHEKGTAHEWTREEARAAGRKGGVASHRFQQQQQEKKAAEGEV